MTRRDLLKTISFLPALGFAQETSVGVPYIYKTAGGKDLRLYVVSPPGPRTPRPAIVFYHGGGWKGFKAVQFNHQAEYLASRGMVAIQVEYRPVGDDPKEPPTVCVQDTKSSMRWVRAHAAELGIDPNRIAAGGGSAGGHLAAWVAMCDGFDDPADDRKVSAKPNALVLYNPVFDNGPGGWGEGRVGDRYPEFSPLHNIKSGAPPTIVFLGSEDKLVPVKTLNEYKARMEKAGARCDAHVYDGQGHGFFNYRAQPNPYYEKTLRATDEFLASLGWLEGPPTTR
jgi:acetyl esterase